MLSKTATRVAEHTRPEYNEAIRRRTAENIAHYGNERPELIRKRIEELDAEWDIERALETNAAAVSLTALLLGRLVHRAFYAAPFFVAGFLLQHALQGWCPPINVMRRLGLRSAREIEDERHALLSALRSPGPV